MFGENHAPGQEPAVEFCQPSESVWNPSLTDNRANSVHSAVGQRFEQEFLTMFQMKVVEPDMDLINARHFDDFLDISLGVCRF